MAALPPLQDSSKQIRLLKPRPTAPGEILSFDISVWGLEKAPPYNAISYTWGDPNGPSEIPKLFREEAEQVELVERLEKYLQPEAITQEYHDSFRAWLEEVGSRRSLAHWRLYAEFGCVLWWSQIRSGENTDHIMTPHARTALEKFDFSLVPRQLATQKFELKRLRASIQEVQQSERRAVRISGNLHLHPVQKSCYCVLQQATRHFPNSRIWVDSICIEQNKPLEKSSQVAIMFKIYQNASRVLAGLGAAADNSGELFALMQTMHAIMDRTDITVERGYLQRSQSPIWHEIFSSLSDIDIASLAASSRSLSDRTYWSRLWVVQELFAGALGGRHVYFMCGSDIVTGHILVWFYELIWGTSHEGVQGRGVLSRIKHRRSIDRWVPTGYWVCHQALVPNSSMMDTLASNHSISTRLCDLFYRNSHLLCADPRDFIYGLIGLVDWVSLDMQPLQPDYSKTPFELALQVRAIVTDGDDVEINGGFCELILSRFGIDETTPDLQALLQRQHDIGSGVLESLPCPLRDQRYAFPLYNQSLNNAVVECVELSEVRGDELAVPPLTTWQGSIKEMGRSTLSSRLQSSSGYKYVKDGPHMIAALCPEAIAGDVLIQAWFPERIALVLRRSIDVPDKFDIVGQAMLEFDLGSRSLSSVAGPGCRCPEDRCIRFAAEVDMALSVGDALALEAQDFDRNGFTGLGSRNRRKRLSVFPVANRIGSVTLRYQRCLGRTKFNS
ncbi:hypothetical protein M409DRAFT_16438 [Zasmidium cellare ATCC 36951]|uniref:Heterokaryon incompatibility domain-containing protein n=1 Tax=Zasmidium cellare ATCC 36951 TaxID=1080233 RepID=A0A6A6D7L2_ZASCE|nr:uncharacterized protein M409DRAFT_16438 [Zasmidium cellare ATCC 36951]KAF2174169.1 hypothetical protein M409DRAFT_16438 [Zasmidium cellare ATCC 36951]